MTDIIKDVENIEALDEEKVVKGQSALNNEEDSKESFMERQRKRLTTEEEEDLLKQAAEKWLKYIQGLCEQGDVNLSEENPLEKYALIDLDNKVVALLTPAGKVFSYSLDEDGVGNSVEKISYSQKTNNDKAMDFEDAVAMVRLATMQGWPAFKILTPTNPSDTPFSDAPNIPENDLFYLAMIEINKEEYLKQGEPENFKPIITISNYKPAEDSRAYKLAQDMANDFKWLQKMGIKPSKDSADEPVATDEIPEEEEPVVLTDATPIEEPVVTTDEAPEDEEPVVTADEAPEEDAPKGFTPEDLIVMGNEKKIDDFLEEILEKEINKDTVLSLPAPDEEETQEPIQEEKVFSNGKENAIDADFEVVEEAPNTTPPVVEKLLIEAPEQKVILLQNQSSGEVIHLGDGKTLSESFSEKKDKNVKDEVEGENPTKPKASNTKGLTPRNQP